MYETNVAVFALGHKTTTMRPNRLSFANTTSVALFFSLLLVFILSACDNDEDVQTILEEQLGEEEVAEEEENPTPSDECPSQVSFYFEEQGGLVSVEFEDNEFDPDWELRNDATGTSGEGYRVWVGNQTLRDPGNGLVVFPIAITKTGTYRFVWNSSFRQGNQGSEHNDSWLRFADAADFFGSKNDGESIVYPNGTGKTPNPEGSSADGWFKIYRSGNNNDFKWQSSTSDNDAHNVFVTFDTPGIYTMEVSARSSFHGIDRFMLFHSDLSFNEALDAADTFSVKKTCP